MEVSQTRPLNFLLDPLLFVSVFVVLPMSIHLFLYLKSGAMSMVGMLEGRRQLFAGG